VNFTHHGIGVRQSHNLPKHVQAFNGDEPNHPLSVVAEASILEKKSCLHLHIPGSFVIGETYN